MHHAKDMINCMTACVALHPNDVVRMHAHVYASKLANCHVGVEHQMENQVNIGVEGNYKIPVEPDSNIIGEGLLLMERDKSSRLR